MRRRWKTRSEVITDPVHVAVKWEGFAITSVNDFMWLSVTDMTNSEYGRRVIRPSEILLGLKPIDALTLGKNLIEAAREMMQDGSKGGTTGLADRGNQPEDGL